MFLIQIMFPDSLPSPSTVCHIVQPGKNSVVTGFHVLQLIQGCIRVGGGVHQLELGEEGSLGGGKIEARDRDCCECIFRADNGLQNDWRFT